MPAQRRMRRVDDWFRPVRADGTPRPPRSVSAKDRRWSAAALLTAVVALVVLAVAGGGSPYDVLSRGGWFPLGYALVQVVFLLRTRHLGWT